MEDLVTIHAMGDPGNIIDLIATFPPGFVCAMYSDAAPKALAYMIDQNNKNKEQQEVQVPQQQEEEDFSLHFTQSQETISHSYPHPHSRPQNDELDNIFQQTLQEFVSSSMEPMSPIPLSLSPERPRKALKRTLSLTIFPCTSIDPEPPIPLRPLKLFRHDPIRDFAMYLSKMEHGRDLFNLLGINLFAFCFFCFVFVSLLLYV